MRAFHFVNSLNLDVENPDQRLNELKEISFDDFLKKYPPKIAKILRETACFLAKQRSITLKK